ncbi:uncharacterized protein LOC9636650 isoform X2 [Selaginella moellendorffii]|uniref:uncharacterized protein LOC9636650 isoform X2 n=1 Tax=Selaginella moellendorffii TaxID=88036 RepID=UPI000D1D07D9|nr:uncharacterized protein LOC9636650 isoform X2 [Selaginella moellendorffii]|eukprot:XP_024517819.1 uncharacterized protein LOC9636650 isoform X2 [Selaginella moellendorffii]
MKNRKNSARTRKNTARTRRTSNGAKRSRWLENTKRAIERTMVVFAAENANARYNEGEEKRNSCLSLVQFFRSTGREGMASRRQEQRDRSAASPSAAASPRGSSSAIPTAPSSLRARSSTASSSRSPAFDFRGMRDSAREIISRGQRLPARKGETGSIARLPQDLLCKCFLKLDSIFQIINCALVCKVWRDACSLDVIWRSMYLRWHGDYRLDISRQQSPFPPSGFGTWRESFIRDFPRGRVRLLERTIKQSLDAGFLQALDEVPHVLNFTPGKSIQTLAQELQLTFYLRINNGQRIRLTRKQAVWFPASTVLHCPFKYLKRGMKLFSLASLEVIVSSDTLSQCCQVAAIMTKKPSLWESDYSAPPLRLAMLSSKDVAGAMNLIVGTLFEQDNTDGNEEVLFIKVGIHLAQVIFKLFKFRIETQRMRPNPEPSINFGYHVSVQLHTFDHLIWTRNFHGVLWDERESMARENVVLPLISSFEVVPKKLSLPWRSEAFSGTLEHSAMAVITSWDVRREAFWQIVKTLHLKLVSVPSVEYVEPGFEGPQFEATVEDKSKGLSAAIKCSLPLENSVEMFAITDLRLSLSKKFVREWFGVNI